MSHPTKSLADKMREARESILRSAEFHGLGALQGEYFDRLDSIVYKFERGTVTSRLPTDAVTETRPWVQRP